MAGLDVNMVLVASEHRPRSAGSIWEPTHLMDLCSNGACFYRSLLVDRDPVYDSTTDDNKAL